jgi:hypothetical protein
MIFFALINFSIKFHFIQVLFLKFIFIKQMKFFNGEINLVYRTIILIITFNFELNDLGMLRFISSFI